MKTATRGTATIVKRMHESGLPYEVTNVSQISTFVVGGNKYVAIAMWENVNTGGTRTFIGFYDTWNDASTASINAGRRHGVHFFSVIKVMERQGESVPM